MPRPRKVPLVPPVHTEPLRVRAELLGDRLRQGFQACLSSLGLEGARVGEVARKLKVQPVLASRLVRCLEHQNPVAVVFHAPGPEPLRDALEGFSQAGAPDEPVLQLVQAIEHLDQMIRFEFGDQRGLEAALAPWVSGGMASLVPRQRLAIHRSAMESEGLEIEASSFSVAFVPATEGTWRSVRVTRLLGVTRWLPEATFGVAMDRPQDEATCEVEGLDGKSFFEGGLAALRQDDFALRAPAELSAREVEGAVIYDLQPTGFGSRAAVDLNLVERARTPTPMRRPSAEASFGASTVAAGAVGHQMLEVLLPRGLFEPLSPEAVSYCTLERGTALVAGQPGREADLRTVLEEVQQLELSSPEVALEQFPRHADLLTHALESSDADPSDFLLYRILVQRPFPWIQLFLSWMHPDQPREQWIPERELYQ